MMKADTTDLPLGVSGAKAVDIAAQAIRGCGEILRTNFGATKKVHSKGKRNLVTNVDLLASEHFLGAIRCEYPGHGFIDEESGESDGASEYRWIVDPLDGTTNYAYGIPFFSVAVALARTRDVLLGMVYDPLRDELFWAVKGGGAFLNDRPVGVKTSRANQTMLVGCDLGYNDDGTVKMLGIMRRLWTGEQSFRIMGSAALGLTYVAAGRLDTYLHPSIYSWDVAGGILITREAGGEVVDWQGTPATAWSDSIIASGGMTQCEEARKALALSESRPATRV